MLEVTVLHVIVANDVGFAVNPLGLQITYFRVDQAFEEAGR